jgi:hypothetical protein
MGRIAPCGNDCLTSCNENYLEGFGNDFNPLPHVQFWETENTW